MRKVLVEPQQVPALRGQLLRLLRADHSADTGNRDRLRAAAQPNRSGRAGTRAHLQTAKGDSFTVHALFRRFSLEMILA